MEVTTVSPSPTSPIKGDDLCETDVTNVALHSVMLLICFCGLAANGAVICLLKLKPRNARIFDLAVADFFFLLFTVPSALLFLLEDVSCSTIMPLMYVKFLFQLSMVSFYWGLFRLMRIGMMNNMYKLRQLCRCCHPIPWRLLWVVESVKYGAFFALFTVIPMVTLQCPSHEKEHCRVALISMFTTILILFAAPMVIVHTSDFIKAKFGSKKQQLKRRDIVIFFVVLFTLLLSLWNFLHQLSYIAVSSEVVFLLACINSTIKPFIYFLAGQSWRPCSMRSLQLSLQRVFEEQKDNIACSNDATRDTVV